MSDEASVTDRQTETTPDLTAIMETIAAAPNDDAAISLGPEHLSSRLGLILLHWPALRAALEQRAELEGALREIVEAKGGVSS